MRKLALSDEILMKVDKPARYIGNEVNSVMKRYNFLMEQAAALYPLPEETSQSVPLSTETPAASLVG